MLGARSATFFLSHDSPQAARADLGESCKRFLTLAVPATIPGGNPRSYRQGTRVAAHAVNRKARRDGVQIFAPPWLRKRTMIFRNVDGEPFAFAVVVVEKPEKSLIEPRTAVSIPFINELLSLRVVASPRAEGRNSGEYRRQRAEAVAKRSELVDREAVRSRQPRRRRNVSARGR
jgi:hypothetical protein